METSTIYIISNLDGLFNFYHNAIQRSRMSDRSSSCSATQRWRLFSAIPRAPPLSMVNYKGHLFAFRVPFIQAVTSLQAQINEDQHPLAIRCRRLTFSSTKVAYSPRSSQPPPSPSFRISPSVKFRFRVVVRRSSYTRRPFNDRSPNLLANRFFEESFTGLDGGAFGTDNAAGFIVIRKSMVTPVSAAFLTNRSSAFDHVIPRPDRAFHQSASLLLNCSFSSSSFLLDATFKQF